MGIIQVELTDRIAVLTVNRPEKLNALNRQVLIDLDAAIDDLEKAVDLRCVILTGGGEKAFVAGADIAEMKDFSEAEAREFSRFGNEVFRRIELLPMPVIASVNGYALGGGCELALCCDFRIASVNAVFALPETSLGILPGFGGTQRLSRVVGYSSAARMVFTAEKVDASRALAVGLIDEIAEKAELAARSLQIAKMIAENGPQAVRAAKSALQRGLQTDIEGGLSIETGVFSKIFDTEDCREGLAAFLEKRPRNFKNR